jgi:hypothetical protein
MANAAPLYRLTVYQPRWHGWAMWELVQIAQSPDHPNVRYCYPIHKGWTRRPRHSRVEQYDFDTLRVE